MDDNPKLPAVMKPIESRILLIRGLRVIIDADLAELYGVSTKALNQAVKRNPKRFPINFMITLSRQEKHEVVTKCDHLSRLRFSKTHPYAFTEHGALMAATVLKSERAEEMSVFIVQAFVKLREMLSTHRLLSVKLAELEKMVGTHDKAIKVIFDALKQLTATPVKTTKKIGFTGENN